MSVFSEDRTFQQPFNLTTTGFMIAFHVCAIAALFMLTWTGVAMAVVLYCLAGCPGIGMGYHRLLTHRGYKTPIWMEYFLTLCGTLALEGGPIAWVATHRIHHQNTDKEGDPHSPQDGGLWAHMGWIITGKAMHQNTDELLPYVPDLRKHKFHMWITTYHWVPSVVLAVIIAATLGWKVMMVAMFLRAVLGLHSTWLVNSATHMWGSRRFITTDTSTNSFWVAILTFGEGWHNNHHAAPQAARHGLAWYEIDMNWYGIAVLRALGLAWDIKFNKLTPNAHLAHPEAAVAPELVPAAIAEPEPEAVAAGD
jgi:fatty-acid desaturase